ncbi:MAG: beta-ketoacyl-ACP synthase 3 [Lentisphaeraceae bacterium]|nr:beta-ketoacyl-ACP synthase 3 [Lentisphaeraceae bacterium]
MPSADLPQGNCESTTLLSLYKSMFTARVIDKYEDQYTSSGSAFFHVSGAGHEGTAALNHFLIPEDYLHLHYRDKALMLARGIEPEVFFDSLFCKDKSHSRGRQMSAHLSDRELNIMSLVGPVGNNALQAVGVGHVLKKSKKQALVINSMGEGTSQEGEVLEAIAEAVREELPVLFLVQDNNYAISTLTSGKTFYSTPKGEAEEFYSMPVTRVDGNNILDSLNCFKTVTSEIRSGSGPQVVVFNVERLASHSNADDHKIYRDENDLLEINESSDPLKNLEALLLKEISQDELSKLQNDIETSVKEAANRSIRSPEPEPIFDALKELPQKFYSPDSEYRGKAGSHELTMLEALREVLKYRLTTDPKVSLYGEDIEDPKGDVFGLTRGLSTAFPGRVSNSPLSESTIVGVSAGKALAGEKPVAFLQFADFLPIALNQIITEIATMHWRTDGSWQVPMVIMITCGGYRPGLGPFHAQTFEALATHTPGIDVFMPSTAGDAAGMLNTAFESGRPSLIFYPKSCLNESDNATSKDVEKHFLPLGVSRTIKTGKDITLVGWGNTISRCLKAAESLEDAGFTADVIDLRTLAPWDKESVLKSVNKTKRLIVTHEDNLTCGMGSEVLATVLEQTEIPIKAARVTREDTFVPCNFSNQLEVLPSYKRILSKAAELLDCEIAWEDTDVVEEGTQIIEAIGTSPSDETITIHDWLIEVGDEIEEGQEIAYFEANKATADLLAPCSGKILELLVGEGETVNVGTALAKVASDQESIPKPATFERPGTPTITKKTTTVEATKTTIAQQEFTEPIITNVATVHGDHVIPNVELLSTFEGKTSEEIIQMTGIEQRNRITESQNLLSLATSAANKVLKKSKLNIEDIDAIICTTGTPDIITPSLACRVLNELAGDRETLTQAHDINAACSGYIYGLQNAYDILSNSPESNILLITAEVLSPLLDDNDFTTAIIFGDAATATIVSNNNSASGFKLKRPLLSASGESGDILSVPTSREKGAIFMDGRKVFTKAVKQMSKILERACITANTKVDELDLIVPHQANQRIIDAIRSRNNLPEEKVFSNIKDYGNTSSSTIPICLEEIWDTIEQDHTLGLCAFGGGFTFGACVLERN